MNLAIILFGALSVLAGIVILFNPEVIFGHLRRNIDRPAIQITAVAVRLVIGALLIQQSAQSKYPLAIEILGWLAIAAAAIMAVMGRRNFIALMTWALDFLKPYGRAGGVFAAAFGGFLVYAFV